MQRLRQVPTSLRRLPAAFGRQVGQPYDRLARRGQQMVARLRKQMTTQQLVEQADETIHRARAARAATQAAGRATPPGSGRAPASG
jgi:hypothetical protein